jgi:FlaA1/EpsC-like NDP-sugar epimerase
MMSVDILLLVIVVWAAFALRTGESLSTEFITHWYLVCLLPFLSLPIFHFSGLYNVVVRFLGPTDVGAIARAVSFSALAFLGVYMLAGDGIPRTSIVIFWLLGLLLIGGSRLLVRAAYQTVMRLSAPRVPVAIYGAGSAGRQLAISLLATRDYEPVAFIDDAVQGRPRIRGIPVQPPQELTNLVKRLGVKHVLLAMPSLSGAKRKAVIEFVEQYGVMIRTIPPTTDLVSGQARVEELREVDVSDILGRDVVAPEPRLLTKCVAKKTVMVTGAGGSIGGELCRQLLNLEPTRLVILEQSELALYKIERELNAFKSLVSRAGKKRRGLDIVPCLGSVHDRRLLEILMRKHLVETVYHAAAYKHVPLVEMNPLEGLKNNTFGTWSAACAAKDAGVTHFILVSTDKAVRPTSAMGASKRDGVWADNLRHCAVR